jgi:hypothetical protein
MSSAVLQGSLKIDHNVISIEIDLVSLCKGRITEYVPRFLPTRLRLPKKTSKDPKEVANRDILAKLTREAAASIPQNLSAVYATNDVHIEDRAQLCAPLATKLQTILGESIVQPFMAQPKRRSAKKLNDFLREHYASVTYINKCIKYINLLYNHIHHGASLSGYRKGWANIALHTTPSSPLVTAPMVDDQTIRTDPARHNTWLTYARMAQKELWNVHPSGRSAPKSGIL